MAGKGNLSVLRRFQFVLWGLAAGAAIIAFYIAAEPKRNASEPIAIGGPFTLTDETGKRVQDTDYDGKLRIVYFGFTHCPDVCPTSLILIASALERLGPKAGEFQPLLISLDPERDTPEALAAYTDDIWPTLIGLTGTTEEIAQTAGAYKVGYWKVADPNSIMPYTVDHASIIFVMDRKGRYVRHYDHGVSADELAAGLEAALSGR